jgi:hypothetical protein
LGVSWVPNAENEPLPLPGSRGSFYRCLGAEVAAPLWKLPTTTTCGQIRGSHRSRDRRSILCT